MLAVVPQQVFAVEPRHMLEMQSPATRQAWLSAALAAGAAAAVDVGLGLVLVRVRTGRLGAGQARTADRAHAVRSWAQPLPSAHFPLASARHGPPQSTSVSVWFSVWSEQVAATHNPSLQTPLTQLVPTLQVRPTAHFAQVTPFGFGAAVRVALQAILDAVRAGRQLADLGLPPHTPLMQSRARLHATPSAQGPQRVPPQLMPVSSPFWTVSLQV